MSHTHESADSDAVLAALRRMPETDLHKDVIRPLLTAIGATNIAYVHGPQERGKDFIYIVHTVYGMPKLAVCQVKNERLTGRSTSASAVTTVLNQLLQCHNVEVLNPLTNAKELPQEIVLFTTYALPDAPLADAQSLLEKVRQTCTIIGPEHLTRMLLEKLPSLYYAYAAPGKGILRRMRQFVSMHHEAIAFEATKTRPLDSFLVNLGISLKGTQIAKLLKHADTSHRTTSFDGAETIDTACFDAINALFDTLPFKSPVLLTAITAIHKDNPARQADLADRDWRLDDTDYGDNEDEDEDEDEIDNSRVSRDRVSVQRPNVRILLNALKQYLYPTCPNGATDAGPDISVAINAFSTCDDIIGYIVTEVHDLPITAEPVPECESLSLFSRREVDPVTLLDCNYHLCITGTAGAGKTCLSRSLVQKAIDRGSKCIYFPAARVSGTNPLSEDIKSFLRTLSEDAPESSVQELWEQLDLIVIDGCDEAPTFGEKLGHEIVDLILPKAITSKLPRKAAKQPWIPKLLEDSVQYSDHDKQITLESPLGINDFTILLAGNKDNNLATHLSKLQTKYNPLHPRIVITTRSETLLKLPPCFKTVTMSPFDDDQLRAFFRKWFHGTSKSAEDVITFIDNNEHVKEICRVPITATIVAVLHENDYDLPRSRTEVYTKRFDLLLSRWDRARRVPNRTRINPNDKMLLLSRLALSLHSIGRRQFKIHDISIIWKNGLNEVYPGVSIEQVIAELHDVDTVIYSEGGDEYSLGHLSYQEFLAAYAIVHAQDYQMLATKFNHTWWRQTIIFFAGISREIDNLLAAIQEFGAMTDLTGLLEEMFAEARHSSSQLKSLFDDFREDGLLGTEESDFEYEADAYDESNDY